MAAVFSIKIARLSNEDCPHDGSGVTGLMPCGGPALAKADILTVTLWIRGGELEERRRSPSPNHWGPRLRLQAAGEFDADGSGIADSGSPHADRRYRAVRAERLYGAHVLRQCQQRSCAPHRERSRRLQSSPQAMQLRIDGKLQEDSVDDRRCGSGGASFRRGAGRFANRGARPTPVILTRVWSSQRLWRAWTSTCATRAARRAAGRGRTGQLAAGDAGWHAARRRAEVLADRYRQLYEELGDAWQVTDSTSLFDYAPGALDKHVHLSDVAERESPSSCFLPVDLEGPSRPPPPADSPDRRVHEPSPCARQWWIPSCEVTVSAMYRSPRRNRLCGGVSASQTIESNRMPTLPVQISPPGQQPRS